ncbi:MAG: LPS export ABC transporter periplasmic protein LptC [Bacteriovoracia bacterium]
MTIRDPKSIGIVFVYVLINFFIIMISLRTPQGDVHPDNAARTIAPDFTEIEKLDYFHLKEGSPIMSLSATKMRSQGEEVAEFEVPKGVYNYQQKKKTIKYSAEEGIYQKKREVLTLTGDVKVSSDEAQYFADSIKYFFTKDQIIGTGNVKFEGEDLKSRDYVTVTSESMHARPEKQLTTFKGNVKGNMQRKKKYEGKMIFSSHELQLDGNKSLAHLEGDVRMKRDNYDITAGKADIYLENFNKSLKYFVLNDDVKLTEKLQTNEGPQERKAFAARLEGFGREEKMVLSGAPRVEMGSDVIKGYRITIRENVDLIEVDDAMSDVQVKRKKLKE